MKWRNAVRVGIVAAFAGYCGFRVWYALSEGVTPEDFARVETGMSKCEVRGILGWEHSYGGYVMVKGQTHVDIEGKRGTAMLAFDERDRLI